MPAALLSDRPILTGADRPHRGMLTRACLGLDHACSNRQLLGLAFGLNAMIWGAAAYAIGMV